MNAIIKPDVAGAALVPGTLADAIRLAEVMARAHTVPKHLQDSPGDCLMVIEQAMRWQMSPFAVAQATSVISGKLMFEGKLVAAAVETSGAIQGHLDYSFTGHGEDRAVIVSATRRGETEPRSVTVTLKEARTDNRMWRQQPDQQLVYHGARVWARRWTPAVILGVYSREEFGRIIDVTPEPETAPEPAKPSAQEPAADLKVGDIAAPVSAEAQSAQKPAKRRTIGEWLDNLELQLLTAQTMEDVDLILASREVQEAQQKLKNGAQERLTEMIRMALDRLQPTDGEVTPEDRLGA